MLLWINFGSITDTLLAMSVIPMAIIGGVLALFVTGIPFSVSAAIGFIALFGICRHGRHHRAVAVQQSDRRRASTGPRRRCAPARCRCGRC